MPTNEGCGGGEEGTVTPVGWGPRVCPFPGKATPVPGRWEPLAVFPWIRPAPGASTITFGSKSSVPDVGIYLGTLQANVKSPRCLWGKTNPENPEGLGSSGSRDWETLPSHPDP